MDFRCDNMVACLAVDKGRSRDAFLQHCVRELFVLGVRYDLELRIVHQPGRNLERADALSRMHAYRRCEQWVRRDPVLRRTRRVRVPVEKFRLVWEL